MSSFFTGAVVVAICTFVAKEVLEFIRRLKADRRKVAAYKLLLADEVEKNNWVIRSLRFDLKELKEDWSTSTVTMEINKAGQKRLKIVSEDGESSGVLPDVSRMIVTKVFTDIAVLDEKLFSAATEAYEAVSELEHVKNSLIEFVMTDDKLKQSSGFRDSFVDYAFREIADAYVSLSKLYKLCTGNDLADHKLRSFA